jgi:hypothetical protein
MHKDFHVINDDNSLLSDTDKFLIEDDSSFRKP